MESAVKPADQTVVNVLEIFATTVAGLTAGGMLYVSLIEAPGRGKLSPSQQLRSWRSTFPRAAKWFPASCVSLVLAFCTCAYQTAKPSYYFSAAAFGFVVPFTIITLSKINKRLMDMDIDSDDDKCKEVPALLAAWAKRHVFRVGFTTAGFVVALVTAVLKR